MGDWPFSIPPLYIASNCITVRQQSNQKLPLTIVLCSAYYKYDILTWIEVGGNNRNSGEGIYSLCSSLCWNTLRQVNKQTMLRQCSFNACVGSTEMWQTGKSESNTSWIMVVHHRLAWPITELNIIRINRYINMLSIHVSWRRCTLTNPKGDGNDTGGGLGVACGGHQGSSRACWNRAVVAGSRCGRAWGP